MTTLRQAAQAVVARWDGPLWQDGPTTGSHIATLRKALDAPEQEPIGYVWKRDFIGSVTARKSDWELHETPVYAAPVGLEALTKERDEYRAAADKMAAAHKIERDALLAAGKLALDMCVEFSRATMTQVEYLNLLRTIRALKKAGVTA